MQVWRPGMQNIALNGCNLEAPNTTSRLRLLALDQPVRLQTTLDPLDNDLHQKRSRKRRERALDWIRIQPRQVMSALDLPHVIQFGFREAGAHEHCLRDLGFG